MARVNFREVRERFTHIDAEFVSCELGFGGVAPRYTVRFYPLWEHPAFVEAQRTGKPWGFAGTNDVGAKEVTVYPLGLDECRISAREIVVDWAFHESHLLLWPYEDQGQIYCNSECRVDELARRVQARVPHLSRADLYRYLDPLLAERPPFCVGTFPFSLFRIAQEELAKMGVAIYVAREPKPRKTPVLFLIDSRDFIIADDFEFDVPVFEHKAEWFKPA